jgi:hypothetical protein
LRTNGGFIVTVRVSFLFYVYTATFRMVGGGEFDDNVEEGSVLAGRWPSKALESEAMPSF